MVNICTGSTYGTFPHLVPHNTEKKNAGAGPSQGAGPGQGAGPNLIKPVKSA